MKKLAAILLILVLVCSAAMAESMMVHITAACYDTNHVGTNWTGYYEIGGYQVHDGDVIDLVPAKYEFYSEIGEYDASPDIGSVSTTCKITETRLNKGFTYEQVLQVYENQGGYSGYWCEWYVDFQLVPVTGAMYVLN